MPRQWIFVIVLALCGPVTGYCGEADVLKVDVEKTGKGSFHFDVTVQHDDTGWDHYADKWDLLAPDGTVLGSRTLYHPHVGEQPFTRSLSGVGIPEDISRVTVRAHDSVHAYGGRTLTVELPR
ncbi:hypothetical protein DSCA_20930 [Desulfosarcina alkanivorans]|jgi:hypothetical protein|uniref:Uncharacterized protein n=1 Tax=Desulfosarcina alkanivorans TaxID=571177 RepID=A0A5K7YHX2_9BACT|nr:hypothetical protein [Desulfosarcina alkanivorans]BBO68163.1 hypothetical protein DSCA_20930 [Desulfosarcina alkanivorans]